MIRIAIIEGDTVIQGIVCDAIHACNDVRVVRQKENAADARVLIKQDGYDVLLCDLGLPDGSGIDLIRDEAIKNFDNDILVITMFANQKSVLDAVRAGARLPSER